MLAPPLYVAQTILMAIMIDPTLSMEATNSTQPSNESRSSSHSSSWGPATPVIVIFAILVCILYLTISCHRRPFGEVIRPYFTLLLFDPIPLFGNDFAPIEMRDDVSNGSYV
ncbi:hypothetical protein P691DRAFT_755818 [Macrolepiota fuliginosa MF-IS2]|uniref:Uncharacterized protein n=1 Tax=Macrolepiota fuliginosa MF-IS2 TaxID=1400762 RepID=A0A9P5XP93_9AGAR|nr:hypothetical protein P691DRAFT_755818 [Macrolepiota fuliginosa MF-IS2]